MQAYKEKLIAMKYAVHYVNCSPEPRMGCLIKILKEHDVSRIYIADVVDSRLEKRIIKETADHDIQIEWLPTPNFLTPRKWGEDFFAKAKHYSQNKFYIAQRKRLKILIDNGKPMGGKWSYDPENRRKIPRDLPLPELKAPSVNKYTREAQDYIEKNFPSHPGNTENFLYPVTHEDAKAWLKDFFKNRFEFFGDYEDAMVQDRNFLFHSVLTPMLNIGLITPKEIIDGALSYAENHRVPLNSLEGFIRQIIGWREFMRIVYVLEEERERQTNFWKFTKKIPKSFYEGTTTILPVDTVIRRLHEHAYVHHIERLMILGNIMLLCAFDPNAVYRWFMELFIDAYDWVMVPNVYGMSQYADGGLITTKPYISSSAYIRKMSDFTPGPWCEIWDALYWRFIHKHRDFFARNPRMKVMTYRLDKMRRERLNRHLRTAEEFLADLS